MKHLIHEFHIPHKLVLAGRISKFRFIFMVLKYDD